MTTDSASAGAHEGAPAGPPVRVWDLPVRLFHWSLVASFAVAWFSVDSWRDLHRWAGYAAAALVAFRLVWGVIGTRYARFSEFVRGPVTTVAFLRQMVHRDEPRYLGHNPAGAAMIIALITLMTVTALTGWMYTLDAFWGVTWVERTHAIGADALLGLVLVHIAGVVHASFHHHENLVRAMFDGKKRPSRALTVTAMSRPQDR